MSKTTLFGGPHCPAPKMKGPGLYVAMADFELYLPSGLRVSAQVTNLGEEALVMLLASSGELNLTTNQEKRLPWIPVDPGYPKPGPFFDAVLALLHAAEERVGYENGKRSKLDHAAEALREMVPRWPLHQFFLVQEKP